VLEAWGDAADVESLAWSPDGLLVVVQRAGAGVQVRDAATGTVLMPSVLPDDPILSRGAGAVADAARVTGVAGVTAAATSPDGHWLTTASPDGGLQRWELDTARHGSVLDTRLDRMLRTDPFSRDALLARAQVAELSGRWSRSADLLGQAELVGAVVPPARSLRALCLAGRLGGARELLARVAPRHADDPAVRAWAAWLEAQSED
jgi:hypothetical protein